MGKSTRPQRGQRCTASLAQRNSAIPFFTGNSVSQWPRGIATSISRPLATPTPDRLGDATLMQADARRMQACAG